MGKYDFKGEKNLCSLKNHWDEFKIRMQPNSTQNGAENYQNLETSTIQGEDWFRNGTHSIDWLIGHTWNVTGLISWSIDWLVDWLVLSIRIESKSWIDWLIEWLGTFCSIDWLIDWCKALAPVVTGACTFLFMFFGLSVADDGANFQFGWTAVQAELQQLSNALRGRDAKVFSDGRDGNQSAGLQESAAHSECPKPADAGH